MDKISYRWTDRAVRLSESVQSANAPKEIQFAASDAVQHFVWATDNRKQARPKGPVGDNYMPGWGAKADKANYHGKKCFGIAQRWLDEHRAKTLVPDFSSDAFNKQAEQEILRAGLIGPRDRN